MTYQQYIRAFGRILSAMGEFPRWIKIPAGGTWMQRPLVMAVVAFILGIIVAQRVNLSLGLVALLVVMLLLAAVDKERLEKGEVERYRALGAMHVFAMSYREFMSYSGPVLINLGYLLRVAQVESSKAPEQGIATWRVADGKGCDEEDGDTVTCAWFCRGSRLLRVDLFPY